MTYRRAFLLSADKLMMAIGPIVSGGQNYQKSPIGHNRETLTLLILKIFNLKFLHSFEGFNEAVQASY